MNFENNLFNSYFDEYKVMTNMLFFLLIQLFIMRFKRVEVQVAQDECENTYHIFQKLQFIKSYNLSIMVPLFIFQIALNIHMIYDNTHTLYEMDPDNFQFNTINIVLTKIVNSIVIVFTLALLINFAIQLVSIVRLIKFVCESNIIKYVLLIMLAPFSVVYINEIITIMTNLWGSTAIKVNWYIQQTEDFDYTDYFKQSEVAVLILKYSSQIS